MKSSKARLSRLPTKTFIVDGKDNNAKQSHCHCYGGGDSNVSVEVVLLLVLGWGCNLVWLDGQVGGPDGLRM